VPAGGEHGQDKLQASEADVLREGQAQQAEHPRLQPPPHVLSVAPQHLPVHAPPRVLLQGRGQGRGRVCG
jgi:hypothetical protein